MVSGEKLRICSKEPFIIEINAKFQLRFEWIELKWKGTWTKAGLLFDRWPQKPRAAIFIEKKSSFSFILHDEVKNETNWVV